MVKFKGQIRVKRIPGRNGVFSVGTLVTGIGEFAVKNAVLDQYEEGLYEGEFVVTHIGSASYTTSGGRLIVETRAMVQSMAITRAVTKPIEAVPMEMDPLDEAQPATVAPHQPAPAAVPAAVPDKPDVKADKPPAEPCKAKPNEAPGASAPAADTGNPDAALFAELWPLNTVVKLDPTDRARLRLQADRLKQLGYRFDAGQQQWEKKAA